MRRPQRRVYDIDRNPVVPGEWAKAWDTTGVFLSLGASHNVCL
jgi:hypothetical protein